MRAVACAEQRADALVHGGREALALAKRRVEVAARDLPHVRVDGHDVGLVEAEERRTVGHLGPDARQLAQRRPHRVALGAAHAEQPLGPALLHDLRRAAHVVGAVAHAEPAQVVVARGGQRPDRREGKVRVLARGGGGSLLGWWRRRLEGAHARRDAFAVALAQRLHHAADPRDVVV